MHNLVIKEYGLYKPIFQYEKSVTINSFPTGRKPVKAILRLHRVTLEMPVMASTGQSASIRVRLTSSRLKGASYWPSIT
jgi:hypothetical protein